MPIAEWSTIFSQRDDDNSPLPPEAIPLVVGWPEGSFQLHPKTTTLKRTIAKSLSHLLLHAHRALDERQRHPPAPAPAATPPTPAPRPGGFDSVRAIPGVKYAVRFKSDGRPLGDPGPEAEALAARGLYLFVTHGVPIGSALGLRDLAFVSLHSERERLLLFHSQGSYLCVSIAPGASNDEVEARVRALLAGAAPR